MIQLFVFLAFLAACVAFSAIGLYLLGPDK